MNPFKSLVIALAAFQTEIRARFNPIVAALPPLESIEASEPVMAVLRSARWAQQDAERMSDTFEDQIKTVEDIIAKYDAKVKSDALAEALTSGEMVRKEDHAILLAQAESKGKSDAQNELAESQRNKDLATSRRIELAKKVGEVAAAAVTDEQFFSEDHITLCSTIEARIAKLTESKVIDAGPTAGGFKILASIPYTVDGQADFAARLPAFAEMAMSLPVTKPAAVSKTAVIATGTPVGGGKLLSKGF